MRYVDYTGDGCLVDRLEICMLISKHVNENNFIRTTKRIVEHTMVIF